MNLSEVRGKAPWSLVPSTGLHSAATGARTNGDARYGDLNCPGSEDVRGCPRGMAQPCRLEGLPSTGPAKPSSNAAGVEQTEGMGEQNIIFAWAGHEGTVSCARDPQAQHIKWALFSASRERTSEITEFRDKGTAPVDTES